MKHIKENLLHKIFGKSQFVPQESIYFYSLHKAGTSLIAHTLRHASNLKHVDYETMIFDNKLFEEPVFYERGHLYGIFRITEPRTSVIYSTLTQHIIKKDFVKDKKIVFLVRDPRDILISLYYSMRESHAESPNPQLNKRLKLLRTQLQNTTLEEFALNEAPEVYKRFEILHELSQHCRHKVILKYEDLINDFKCFTTDFGQYIKIPQNRRQELYTASRPRSEEDPAAHKRSGKTGQYREKLTIATQEKINKMLKPILELFDYKISDINQRDQ